MHSFQNENKLESLNEKNKMIEEESSDRLRRDIKRRMLKLTENSTCHALPNSVRSPHLIVKIVWVLFFVLSCSACSYIIVTSVLKYFDYRVLVKFNLQRELKAEFPAGKFKYK